MFDWPPVKNLLQAGGQAAPLSVVAHEPQLPQFPRRRPSVPHQGCCEHPGPVQALGNSSNRCYDAQVLIALLNSLNGSEM